MRRPDGIGPFSRRGVVLAAAVLAVLAVAVAGWQLVKPRDLEITATFPRVVGLYAGDQVRILGVPVGEVERLDQTPSGVAVRMRVGHGVKVPAGAQAVIVAPNLVAGRFVQLTPVYSSGARMPSGGVIPAARTQVPVEFDELKGALNRLSTDLGPDRTGASPLGRALSVSADNFRGQGESMNQMITQLSAAATTLADNRGDIFLTVRNLAGFTQLLADNDRQVTSFVQQMDQLSGELSGSRRDLGALLDRLTTVLPDVQAYVRENRPLLRDDVKRLTSVSDLLASRRQKLADALQVAPTAISNVYNLYDPTYGGQVGALVFPGGDAQTPGKVLCSLFRSVGAGGQCQNLAGPLGALDKAAKDPSYTATLPELLRAK